MMVKITKKAILHKFIIDLGNLCLDKIYELGSSGLNKIKKSVLARQS
jgi:hypothetical protein